MEQKVTSDYMNKLHVIFSNYKEDGNLDSVTGLFYTYKHCYMDNKYKAMVISAVQMYNRAIGIKAERQLKHEKELESNYVGEIGEKITFNIKDVSVITSWENNFGYHSVTNFIYKIVDEKGNIFTWKTATVIHIDKVLSEKSVLIGTVKDHKEYNTVKQTELWRCKIV